MCPIHRRIEIPAQGFDLACIQIQKIDLTVITVGNTPFADIDTDFSKAFRTPTDQKLFSIGGILGHSAEKLVLPYRFQTHLVQVHFIEVLFAEGDFRVIHTGSGKKNTLPIGTDIVKVRRQIAGGQGPDGPTANIQ